MVPMSYAMLCKAGSMIKLCIEFTNKIRLLISSGGM